jgi:glycosyltransferase involved in cell wall biosynthesis
MFAGRVERNKGVFDILDMADLLARSRPGRVVFDIYGDGSALEGVRDSIRRRGLKDSVVLYGKLTRPDLLDAYQKCHLVVVPTRSDFTEGLAMVAGEAVLMGRPVLASRVVPACEVLGAAAIVARTNDAADYARRIEGLLDDPASYARSVAACEGAAAQFTDPGQGMVEAFRRGFALLESRAMLKGSPA